MTGARWIALGSLAVLAAGVAAAYLHGRVPPPSAPVAAAPESLVVEPPEGVEIAIEQAFKQLPGGEERAERVRWVGEIPGLAYDDLAPERREIFLRFANAERCTCGCGYTLAGCRVYDSTCETSQPLIVALLDSVRAGQIASAAGIRPVPRAAAVDR
jgi:hypothetical protein